MVRSTPAARRFWVYKCWSELNARGKNLYEYYRLYGWTLERYGLAGTGLWTYCSHGVDAWSTPNAGNILIFRHPSTNEPVHSRRYEMFRQGTDDFRYILALRQAAGRHGPQVRAEAEQLIQRAVADVTADVHDSRRSDRWRGRLAEKILEIAAQSRY